MAPLNENTWPALARSLRREEPPRNLAPAPEFRGMICFPPVQNKTRNCREAKIIASGLETRHFP